MIAPVTDAAADLFRQRRLAAIFAAQPPISPSRFRAAAEASFTPHFLSFH